VRCTTAAKMKNKSVDYAKIGFITEKRC